MEDVKVCHQGLKVRSTLFGLEALDILLLCPCFYLASVVAGSMLLAVLVCAGLAVALRLSAWGKLPGFTAAAMAYAASGNVLDGLGRDDVPGRPW